MAAGLFWPCMATRIANDNRRKPNVVYLDDRRPTHCRTLFCMGCGKRRIYTWPMIIDIADLQCDWCGDYDTLVDPPLRY
jgi:hypothetical protein